MLTITNDTITFKNADDTVIELEIEDISLYLTEDLILECNFERFFNLIYLNKEFLNLIFHRVLGGHDIDIFYEDMISPTTEHRLNDDEVLILEWVTDLYKESFTEYIDFFINSTNPNEAHGSIAFLSLSDIKNAQLRISNDITIFEKNNHNPIVKSKKEMTLYEAIKGVLFEISFYGSPTDRNLTSIKIFESNAMFERVANPILPSNNNDDASIMTITELIEHLRETNIESISNDSDLLNSSKNDNS